MAVVDEDEVDVEDESLDDAVSGAGGYAGGAAHGVREPDADVSWYDSVEHSDVPHALSALGVTWRRWRRTAVIWAAKPALLQKSGARAGEGGESCVRGGAGKGGRAAPDS